MAITKRLTKGSALTFAELDQNFTELETSIAAVGTSPGAGAETLVRSAFAGFAPNGATGAYLAINAQNPANLDGNTMSFVGPSAATNTAKASAGSIKHTSIAGANRIAGVSNATMYVLPGNTSETNGGFPLVLDLAVADATPAAGSIFIGIVGTGSYSPVGIEPSAYAASFIGIGADTADANLQLMFNKSNITTPTKFLDLGASFPKNAERIRVVINKTADSSKFIITTINCDTKATRTDEVLFSHANSPDTAYVHYPHILRGSMATTTAVAVQIYGVWKGSPGGGPSGVSQAALDAVAAQIDPGVSPEAVGRALTQADNGKTLKYTGAAAANFTVPNTLTAPFSCEVVKGGAGSPTFIGDGTSVINVPTGKSATVADQYAGVAIQLMSIAPVTVRVI